MKKPNSEERAPAKRDSAGAGTQKARVLVIDDHQMMRQGLTYFVNQAEDMYVCGEADNAQTGMDAIDTLKPDVVLADVSLPGTNGIEFIKAAKAKHPNLPIVILSMHDESLFAERALRAGALAYVMKRESYEEVMKALRKALAGELHVSPRISATMFRRLVGKQAGNGSSSVSMLSDRELEVFEQIGRGKTTREIAEKLSLSVKTIDSHRAHIKEKLRLRTATELVQQAVRYIEHEFAVT